MYNIQLLREAIDSYKAGTEISAFQMEFSWEGDGRPKTLRHKIFMSGVKLGGSFVNIIIHPNLLSLPTSQGIYAEAPSQLL